MFLSFLCVYFIYSAYNTTTKKLKLKSNPPDVKKEKTLKLQENTNSPRLPCITNKYNAVT